jgi:glutamate racemase
MSDDPIGVFDSGVGGLTVMRSIVEALPDEDVVYLGDTARVPYGNRNAETVRRYALNATDLLRDRSIKALVVACNTASAHALSALVDTYDVPVVGVIEPVARRAVETTSSGVIGVLGTRGTVRSGCYPEAIHGLSDDCTVDQVASPLLVPLAEEGWIEDPATERIARHYLDRLSEPELDTLILGCTHYPILQSTLRRVAEARLEHAVALLDSASATAATLVDVLDDHGLRTADDAEGRLDFLLTDLSPAFVEATERFFGSRPDELRHVDIVP